MDMLVEMIVHVVVTENWSANTEIHECPAAELKGQLSLIQHAMHVLSICCRSLEPIVTS